MYIQTAKPPYMGFIEGSRIYRISEEKYSRLLFEEESRIGKFIFFVLIVAKRIMRSRVDRNLFISTIAIFHAFILMFHLCIYKY